MSILFGMVLGLVVQAVTVLWAVPHLMALFMVDFWPGKGSWRIEPPHTQGMGKVRLSLHLELCRRLDVLNNRMERWGS